MVKFELQIKLCPPFTRSPTEQWNYDMAFAVVLTGRYLSQLECLIQEAWVRFSSEK